jgi:hypothetical protein
MAKSLTIEEVKEKKIELESSILKLVQSFESETGSFVSYIDFERKITKRETDRLAKASCCIPCEERKGPVENININMRFDL